MGAQHRDATDSGCQQYSSEKGLSHRSFAFAKPDYTGEPLSALSPHITIIPPYRTGGSRQLHGLYPQCYALHRARHGRFPQRLHPEADPIAKPGLISQRAAP